VVTFVIARRLAYNHFIMMTIASADRRTLKAKVRAVQRLLIKAYGEPPRPAWAGTVRPLDEAEAPVQWDPIDPLDELINTILSQNTNDLNRDRAYHALRA
jgi:endonuclease III